MNSVKSCFLKLIFILVFVSVVLELSYSWVPILASSLSECDLRQVVFPYL